MQIPSDMSPILLAAGIPLASQITIIVLTTLFLWTFSIARDPRSWRRLYQAKFAKSDKFSVNKNKRIDEWLKKYGIAISMFVLVCDVTLIVFSLLAPRLAQQPSAPNMLDTYRMEDVEKWKQGSGGRLTARDGTVNAVRGQSALWARSVISVFSFLSFWVVLVQ